ncbi:MAG TPA: hypothetical protein VLX92_33445 [Kofleriaceae bacterium]|nr:hypothetical protein [Kofleriaceae bacterium]
MGPAPGGRVIGNILSLGFCAQIVVIAVPLVLAALGGAICERSGVIDLALEAKLLFGAFTAAAVSHATGSAYLGVAGALAAGAAVSAVQVYCALWLEADQVIVGIALNIVALSGTRFLLQVIYHEGANSPGCPGFGDAVATNPLIWLGALAALCLPFAVRRTRWGLRLRAAGDRPDALAAVGASPRRARLLAGLVGGALAGAGGAQLSLSVGGFVADMSSDRGYIALAMIILAGWRPALAALAALGMAATYALSVQFQMAGSDLVREAAPLSPYVLTLIVLVVFKGGGNPPASLGRL